MKPGDIITDDKGGIFLLVSYDEALTVLAGTFARCMHISCRAPDTGNFFPDSAEVWCAYGAGLIKAVFSGNSHSETYELSEYEIKGGGGYFPLAVGNKWRYVNRVLPKYTESLYEWYVTWTDGGTVTVPADAFENCIKLTIEYGRTDELPVGECFNSNGSSILGKKEYYLARGVGIVRFDWDWGESLDSSLVLTSYKNPARDDSFFPLAIGCEWEYDESGLTSQGYCAKRVMKIPCGHGGNYLMQDSQEFYYRGTDEEYDTFIAGLAKMSE